MKLLLDAHCFDYKTTEGVNSYIKGLYSALISIASDIEFYIVAADIDNIKSIFGEHDNVTYVPLVSNNKIYRLLFEFPAIIRRYKIDFAHYQYTSPLLKNCKNIVTTHDILFKDFPHMFPLSYRLVKGLLFWSSAKRADLLLTVSNYSKRQLATHFGIAAESIYVTPNAVNEDFYSIDIDSAKEFVKDNGVRKYILYVSRIEPRKNQIALLRAYDELKLWKEGYDLVFIGRKTLPTPEFDSYVDSLCDDVKQRVHIINQVDYSGLKYWYKAASLFVYPALAEGFGIPPIEAGAAQVSCVCSNKTAMGDFDFFGDNLIDIDDSKALKEAIQRNLTGDMSARNSVVSSEIRKKYSWDNIAKDFYLLIKSKFNR